MARSLAWLLALPLAAASMLSGHAAAYSLTDVPADSLHGYLDHAPQAVAVLALLALLGLAWEGRVSHTTSWAPVAALAAGGFTCQEHLERLLHTGQVPLLLTSATFWVGLLLQVPFAALVWLVARRLVRSLRRPARRRPPRLATLPSLVVAAAHELTPTAAAVGSVPGRGPPCAS